MANVLKKLEWLVIAIAVAIAAVYAGDYFLAAHRMSGPQGADDLGSVTVVPTYVIPHKDGRAEIIVGDATTQTCIHSLFPHFGYTPCWYLNRKQPKPTVMSQLLTPYSGPVYAWRGGSLAAFESRPPGEPAIVQQSPLRTD
jgi:hypothetical protein